MINPFSEFFEKHANTLRTFGEEYTSIEKADFSFDKKIGSNDHFDENFEDGFAFETKSPAEGTSNMFEITPEEADRANDVLAGLYQKMLQGDRDAEVRLNKIDPNLSTHRYHLLTAIDEINGRDDKAYIKERIEQWQQDAKDFENSQADFDRQQFVDGYEGPRP